jgi:cytochrome c-type biogenesis protein CcmH/NrfG
MYRLALLVGTLVWIVAPAAAQPDRLLRQFEAANEAYIQGKHEQAVETYRALLDAGHTSAALYHNLGNAYVRLDRVGPAVWAYERARRLRPDDPRLRHNLAYVRRRAGLPPIGPPPRGLAALVDGWSPLLLFVGGLLLLGAGLIGAVFEAGAGRTLAWRPPIAWGPVAVGLLLVAAALGTSYVQAHEHRAVVMNEAVPLRTTPADTAASDSTLQEGTMVEMQTSRAQWQRVRLGNGTAGWIPARVLSEV